MNPNAEILRNPTLHAEWTGRLAPILILNYEVEGSSLGAET